MKDSLEPPPPQFPPNGEYPSWWAYVIGLIIITSPLWSYPLVYFLQGHK
jgi:hypothetical protein